jgi:hypothetical protein
LWGFIGRYRPGVTPQTHPKLDAMVGYAINYYRDFVAPTKQFREPTDTERAALQDLRDALSQLPATSSAEDIQNVVYEIGRREPFLDPVKKGKDGRPGVSLDWFNMLYQVLLGQEKGPRFGAKRRMRGRGRSIDRDPSPVRDALHRVLPRHKDKGEGKKCDGFSAKPGNDDRGEPCYIACIRNALNMGARSCSSGFRRRRLGTVAPRSGRRGSTSRRRTGLPSCTVSARASSTI